MGLYVVLLTGMIGVMACKIGTAKLKRNSERSEAGHPRSDPVLR